MRPLFILDARMKRGARITVFSDNMTELCDDFLAWFSENNFEKRNLWYSDIYSFDNGKRVAKICPTDTDSEFVIDRVDDHDRIKAFRRYRLVAWLKGELR